MENLRVSTVFKRQEYLALVFVMVLKCFITNTKVGTVEQYHDD